MTAAAATTLLGYMLVCSFTPGPGNILALNTTSRYGWRDSKHLILGICVGYGVVQALCTVMLYHLGNVFAPALDVLKYIGGAYMVWLAVKFIRSSPHTEMAEKRPTFREGLLLQLVNVKIYFYISSLLSVYFLPHIQTSAGLAAAGAFAVGIGSTACLTWAFLGVRLQSAYEQYYRVINALLGGFLLYCAWNLVRG